LERSIRQLNAKRYLSLQHNVLQQATKWFGQQKACQLLNISKQTLQQYRDDGLIPFIKLEREILFRESDTRKVL